MERLIKTVIVIGGILMGVFVILISGEYLNWLELLAALFVSTIIISLAFMDWSDIEKNTTNQNINKDKKEIK